MAEFRMPSLGADMDAGTLVEWLVHPGDRVKRGDVIAAVETEKGIIEVEVFTDGIIEQLLVQPGTQVPVGTVLAMLGPTGAPTATMGAVGKAPAGVSTPAEAEPHVPRRDTAVRPPGQPAVVQPVVSVPAPRVRSSPLARKLAAELGIDLHTVQGTGPHGASSAPMWSARRHSG